MTFAAKPAPRGDEPRRVRGRELTGAANQGASVREQSLAEVFLGQRN